MGQDAKLVHRLAAIMATDVVGYSQSMQSDEAGTLAALSTIREATENQIKQHRGRIANTAGDSVLAEFGSAVEAVSCAMALQEALGQQELQVRIGIHTGDVVHKDGDLHGTAVNIAVRLESIANPGGIVVSSAVREDVTGKLPGTFVDLGLRPLKNIEHPLRVYSVWGASSPTTAGRQRAGQVLPLPDKPSIAVLPFHDLSGDHDQEYFADGMVEEIITALSRLRWLFVIARNSSFAYKGRSVDVKQVGRELGVRYILEGSVRKAGSRVRISGQLIDTATGAQLWADRFDGIVEDIFELQDQVTANVVSAIALKLEQAEIERAQAKPTKNLDAYDYFLRGIASFHQWERNANKYALSSFSRAIKLDPTFASAYAMAARCYAQRKVYGWVTDREQEETEAERLAWRAVELGKDDAVPLCFAGWALAFVVRNDTGAALLDHALVLNPNLAAGWLCSGWVRVCLGEHERAIEQVKQAMRLSPSDPFFNRMQGAIATAHFFAGRYREAASWAGEALSTEPKYLSGLRVAAASNALIGHQAVAEKAVAILRHEDETFRISNLEDRLPLRRADDIARWSKGMRLAGLPE
jgi:adenylate cyclase